MIIVLLKVSIASFSLHLRMLLEVQGQLLLLIMLIGPFLLLIPQVLLVHLDLEQLVQVLELVLRHLFMLIIMIIRQTYQVQLELQVQQPQLTNPVTFLVQLLASVQEVIEVPLVNL